jgi:diamine N-acetyltransferase
MTADVRLEPITEDNLKAVFDLQVGPGQDAFVAPNPWSLAQALAEHDIAWPRAVVDGDEVVGFLMLEIDPHEEDGRPFWLWRMMIAADRQRRGYGTAAIALACHEVRSRGWHRAVHELGARRGQPRAVLRAARVRAHRRDGRG